MLKNWPDLRQFVVRKLKPEDCERWAAKYVKAPLPLLRRPKDSREFRLTKTKSSHPGRAMDQDLGRLSRFPSESIAAAD